MKVILESLKSYAWANGISRYSKCGDDISPYFTTNGSIYTGIPAEDVERLSKATGHDLSIGSEFWKTFFIRMTDKPLYLDTSRPLDEVKYLFLKNHKDVQASRFELKAGASYVLTNEDEEAKHISKKNEAKVKAMVEYNRMTDGEKRKALTILGVGSTDTSSEVVDARLFDFVDKDPKKFCDVWLDNKTRNEDAFIGDCLNHNVLKKQKGAIFYNGERIGMNLTDASNFLKEPVNNDILMAIKKQLDISKIAQV